jgi:CheY-like chemotaxis protein
MPTLHADSKVRKKTKNANADPDPWRVHLPLIEVSEMKEIEEKAHELAERSLQRLPKPDLPEESQPRVWRLLFVEDDAIAVLDFIRVLTAGGHTVTTAHSLAEARAASATHTFDFVICDIGLPDGSGFDLMPELRDWYGLRGIAVSGQGNGERRRQARDAGFADYLAKPVSPEDVLRAIERVA